MGAREYPKKNSYLFPLYCKPQYYITKTLTMSLRIKQPGVVLLGMFFSCLLNSCEKKNCNPPNTINITTNSPIVEGWNLNLETVSIAGGRYVWSGPNGWKVDNQTIGSDDNMESISNLTPSQAGDYSVKVYNHEGCLVSEGKTTVEVIAPPNPPCTVSPNTNQISAAGVLGSSFTCQYFASVSGTFDVTGSSAGSLCGLDFGVRPGQSQAYMKLQVAIWEPGMVQPACLYKAVLTSSLLREGRLMSRLIMANSPFLFVPSFSATPLHHQCQ
jgi:hypothetical protein